MLPRERRWLAFEHAKVERPHGLVQFDAHAVRIGLA